MTLLTLDTFDPHSVCVLRVISSPPELGGVRGGLRSALPLATEGTQEQALFLRMI